MKNNIFVLVADGKPQPYETFNEAVKQYLHRIDKSPNAYEYKETADQLRLEAEINKNGKLIFYAFTNDSAPTAIALYKSSEPYNESEWFNKAAMENPKNKVYLSAMEEDRKTLNATNAKNKVLALGDFIKLTDGSVGRIDVINNDTMQVTFEDMEDTSYPMSSYGTAGARAGIMGDLFKKPTRGELLFGERKLGAYWVRGAGGSSQGNKRLDIYAQTNTWLVNTLDTVR